MEVQTERPIPDYISPILKPSTNPRFEIDTQGGFEFSPIADLGASTVVVEIWGRLSNDGKDKGKGKEKAHPLPSAGDKDGKHEWQILKTWDVDLNKLVPLTDEVRSIALYFVLMLNVIFLYLACSALLTTAFEYTVHHIRAFRTDILCTNSSTINHTLSPFPFSLSFSWV